MRCHSMARDTAVNRARLARGWTWRQVSDLFPTLSVQLACCVGTGSVWRPGAAAMVGAALGLDPEELGADRETTAWRGGEPVDAGACSGGAWSAAAAGDPGALLDRRRAYERLLVRLRGRERAMLVAYLDGATLEEVGAEHGVTRERVRQVLRAVGRRYAVLMAQVLGR